MAEVFAGFVCGFGLSLFYAPLFAVTLLRMRAESAIIARLLPPGVNPVALTLILQGGFFLFWTGIGIIFGLVLLALDDAPSGIGSLNAPYTFIVFVTGLSLTAPFAVVIDDWRRQIIVTGIVAFLVFGYLMPYLASWSKFD